MAYHASSSCSVGSWWDRPSVVLVLFPAHCQRSHAVSNRSSRGSAARLDSWSRSSASRCRRLPLALLPRCMLIARFFRITHDSSYCEFCVLRKNNRILMRRARGNSAQWFPVKRTKNGLHGSQMFSSLKNFNTSPRFIQPNIIIEMLPNYYKINDCMQWDQGVMDCTEAT